MKDKIKLDMDNKAYMDITLTIEQEYTMDNLNNLVYKEGGRKRVVDRIKEILNEYQAEYNISQEEIIRRVMKSCASMSGKSRREYEELSIIFEEIQTEKQVKRDIKEGNIEKYERDI